MGTRFLHSWESWEASGSEHFMMCLNVAPHWNIYAQGIMLAEDRTHRKKMKKGVHNK